MKIKEFAHKYSLTFFYTTIILAIILIITLITVSSCRCGDRFEGRRDMMKGIYNNDYNNRGGQMMNRQPRQMDPRMPVDAGITTETGSTTQ